MKRVAKHAAIVIFGWLSLGASPLRADRAPPPKLFLVCAEDCFDAYLRQELSYFDFVRDRHLADYTLVIVRQAAGNGGRRYTVTLARGAADATVAGAPSQWFVALPGAPAQEVRARLIQGILRLLRAALADTAHAQVFELKLPTRDGRRLSTLGDPWNYWVVTPELRGEGAGGSGYYFAELTSALTVRRITEPSKIRLRGSYTRALSGYRLEDQSFVRGDVYGWDSRALYAHALGEHWAIGMLGTGRASQYENLRWHARGGPLLEYNVFPYRENATHQLRFVYQAGAWANWYFEANRAGLDRELRPYHALSLITDVNQPWGSIQWIGQVNSFLDAPSLYRVSTGALISLRLYEGLAITAEGEAALVRDLIHLRGRPVTDLELLLWTTQQPTNYTFEIEFALTYTFGSVHNTIVNPRFGRVDLEEE